MRGSNSSGAHRAGQGAVGWDVPRVLQRLAVEPPHHPDISPFTWIPAAPVGVPCRSQLRVWVPLELEPESLMICSVTSRGASPHQDKRCKGTRPAHLCRAWLKRTMQLAAAIAERCSSDSGPFPTTAVCAEQNSVFVCGRADESMACPAGTISIQGPAVCGAHSAGACLRVPALPGSSCRARGWRAAPPS